MDNQDRKENGNRVLTQANKNTIELVRKYRAGDYEVVHPVFEHYQFNIFGKFHVLSVVEAESCVEALKERGLFEKYILNEEPIT